MIKTLFTCDRCDFRQEFPPDGKGETGFHKIKMVIFVHICDGVSTIMDLNNILLDNKTFCASCLSKLKKFLFDENYTTGETP